MAKVCKPLPSTQLFVAGAFQLVESSVCGFCSNAAHAPRTIHAHMTGKAAHASVCCLAAMHGTMHGSMLCSFLYCCFLPGGHARSCISPAFLELSLFREGRFSAVAFSQNPNKWGFATRSASRQLRRCFHSTRRWHASCCPGRCCQSPVVMMSGPVIVLGRRRIQG